MLRITVVRLLAGIVNRTNLISKQKMYPRGGEPLAWHGTRHQAAGFRKEEGPRKSSILSYAL
jgi:hypothetical protein